MSVKSYNHRVWLLALFILLASHISTPPPAQARQGIAPTYRIFATREGLVGHMTANGHIIQPRDRFVALPSWQVLSSYQGHEFQVRLTYNGRSTVVPVWDVGPWNTNDEYWSPNRRYYTDLPIGVPMAEAAYYHGYNGGLDMYGRKINNPNGIDIADGTYWDDLGMTRNDWVHVTFLWLGEDPGPGAAVDIPPTSAPPPPTVPQVPVPPDIPEPPTVLPLAEPTAIPELPTVLPLSPPTDTPTSAPPPTVIPFGFTPTSAAISAATAATAARAVSASATPVPTQSQPEAAAAVELPEATPQPLDAPLVEPGGVAVDNDSIHFHAAPIYWKSAACGLNGSHDWDYTRADLRGSEARASWKPALPPGTYELKAYIPACGAVPATMAARYAIVHDEGVRVVTIDQHAASGSWVSLGSYSFRERSPMVELSALTDDAERGIRFDAIMWLPSSQESSQNAAPLPAPRDHTYLDAT